MTEVKRWEYDFSSIPQAVARAALYSPLTPETVVERHRLERLADVAQAVCIGLHRSHARHVMRQKAFLPAVPS